MNDDPLVEEAWTLLSKHVGHANPLTSKRLASMLGLMDDVGTQRTRAIIREVVRRGLPVGATTDGYFVLQNRIELERYIQERQDRAAEIIMGSQYVQRAFDGYYKDGEVVQRTPIRWVPEPEERP